LTTQDAFTSFRSCTRLRLHFLVTRRLLWLLTLFSSSFFVPFTHRSVLAGWREVSPTGATRLAYFPLCLVAARLALLAASSGPRLVTPCFANFFCESCWEPRFSAPSALLIPLTRRRSRWASPAFSPTGTPLWRGPGGANAPWRSFSCWQRPGPRPVLTDWPRPAPLPADLSPSCVFFAQLGTCISLKLAWWHRGGGGWRTNRWTASAGRRRMLQKFLRTTFYSRQHYNRGRFLWLPSAL
jgi:hypothetical protein